KEIPEIDILLTDIKYPHYMNRKFNKILIDLKYKSSELKLFVFYLAVPILIDILPDDFWFMLCCYVFSIRTFYEPIKNIDDLNYAKILYEKYFSLLDCFFSKSAYLGTTHAHLHLFEQVYLHGPLQCHSSFCFEGSLFNLKNLLTGTRGFTNQMVKRIFLIKNLSFQKKCDKKGGKIGSTNSFFTSESEYDVDDTEKRIAVPGKDQVSSKKTPSPQISDDLPKTSSSDSNAVEYVETEQSSSKFMPEQNSVSLFKLFQDVQEIKDEMKEHRKILNEIVKLLKGSKSSQEEWPTEIVRKKLVIL
ncbi:unnamed protein product, partial [Brachionus calyciflorus]